MGACSIRPQNAGAINQLNMVSPRDTKNCQYSARVIYFYYVHGKKLENTMLQTGN
jgi:hypothetical protein